MWLNNTIEKVFAQICWVPAGPMERLEDNNKLFYIIMIILLL